MAVEEGLGELAQGEHEGPHPRVILHDEAQVRVEVHLGEEVGVLALSDEPALALELGCDGLVGLVELAQPVEAGDARDGHTAERHQGDHEFWQHTRRSDRNGRLYTSPFYITHWVTFGACRMRPSLFVMATILIRPAHGGLYSLQDSRPVLSSEGLPLHWWDGGPAFTLASAGAVRLNFRGLYTYPPNALVRGEQELMAAGWHGVACNASAWALCSSDVGHALPSGRPRTPERPALVETDGWEDLSCKNSLSKVLVSDGVYDLSACDVLDEGVDLLYTPGKLYHRHGEMPLWKYWLCVGLAIVLVRCLSHNVRGLWGVTTPNHQPRKQWPALAASLVLVALAVLDGDGAYVTRADQVFFWGTIAYIGAYLGMHVRPTHQLTPVFNVIVATLQLAAMRFYTAAETPYNLVLIAMLACRGWTKLLLARQRTHGASVLLDAIYLSLCIELAFNGTRELLVAVLGAAFVAGQLLAGGERKQES
jgi:hypothetical protein